MTNYLPNCPNCGEEPEHIHACDGEEHIRCDACATHDVNPDVLWVCGRTLAEAERNWAALAKALTTDKMAYHSITKSYFDSKLPVV